MPGEAIDELRTHLDSRPALQGVAAWVAGRLKRVSNEEWEVLATVDYAVQALKKVGAEASSSQVIDYISSDREWRPKLERLGLTPFKVESAMLQAQTLLSGL
jgi:hypothetical protein